MAFQGPLFANDWESPLYIDVPSARIYTSGDRIKGHVRVDLAIQRPILVKIIFQGYSVIYDSDANGTKMYLFEYSRILFKSTATTLDSDISQKETAEDGKVELPFHFTFPHKARFAPPSDRLWWHSKDPRDCPRFQHSPGFVLPPTCTPLKTINQPLPPKIIYHLEARLDTVVSDSLHRVRERIKFIPPAPECAPDLLRPDLNLGVSLPKHFCRAQFIKTRKLLPSYGEGGKLGKFVNVLAEKELLSGKKNIEIPYARFNLFAMPARILVIGSPIPVTLTIQHIERSKCLPAPPDLFLRRIRVQLLSNYDVFLPSPSAQRTKFKESVQKVKGSATLFEKKFSDGPGEPLYDGLELAELGDVQLVNNNLVPSFTSYGVSLEHELRVEIWGECAEREFLGVACQQKVQIVSAWNQEARNTERAGTDTQAVAQLAAAMESMERIETTQITHPGYAGGAVQALDGALPRYNRGSTTAAPQTNGELPPPPYAG